MRRTLVAFSVLSFLLCGIAIAEQITGIGSEMWQHRDDRTSIGCITFSDANASCKLFPAGNSDAYAVMLSNVSASGAVTCAWAGDAAAVINAAGNVASGGSFSTGASAGFTLPAPGAVHDTLPHAPSLVDGRVPGASDGVCAQQTQQRGMRMYVPCNFTGGGGTNCASFNSQNLGACIQARPSQLAEAGMFAVCIGGTVHATIQKVRGISDGVSP